MRDRYNDALDKTVKPIDIETLVVNTISDKHYDMEIILNYIDKR